MKDRIIKLLKGKLDYILDVIYYVAFLGILAAVIVITWGQLVLGIRLLVSFGALMGLVVYIIFRTDDKKKEKK